MFEARRVEDEGDAGPPDVAGVDHGAEAEEEDVGESGQAGGTGQARCNHEEPSEGDKRERSQKAKPAHAVRGGELDGLGKHEGYCGATPLAVGV